MNKENMQKVLDYIITHPQEFRMTGWGTFNLHSQCLTSACICGTANYLAGSINLGNREKAAEFLGLSLHHADALFLTSASIWHKYMLHLGLPANMELHDITHHDAVTMLTNLISGEWNFDDLEPFIDPTPVPLVPVEQ